MTSIEWLVEQLEQHYVKLDIKNTVVFEQAKEIHKQEIIDAQSYAVSNADMTNNKGYFDCEHYYQETFVSKGSDDVQLPQQEISDEEILDAAARCKLYNDLDISVGSFELGARWYREQLKCKGNV